MRYARALLVALALLGAAPDASAEAPAAAVQTGTIRIVCEGGLAVFLDGQPAGTSTTRDHGAWLYGVPPGRHTVRIERAGSAPKEIVTNVAAGATAELVVMGFTRPRSPDTTPTAAVVAVRAEDPNDVAGRWLTWINQARPSGMTISAWNVGERALTVDGVGASFDQVSQLLRELERLSGSKNARLDGAYPEGGRFRFRLSIPLPMGESLDQRAALLIERARVPGLVVRERRVDAGVIVASGTARSTVEVAEFLENLRAAGASGEVRSVGRSPGGTDYEFTVIVLPGPPR